MSSTTRKLVEKALLDEATTTKRVVTLPNMEFITDDHVVVRTQAGFNKLHRLLKRTLEADSIRMHNYPAKYPAIVVLHNHGYETTVWPIMKARKYFESVLASINKHLAQ